LIEIDEEASSVPTVKCEACGGQKRVLYEYKSRTNLAKNICENCLMIHILFDDISDFKDETDLDIFARLNAFYSYKANQKDQTLFRLLLRYLWQRQLPDITEVRKLWERHYKDPLEDYLKRFQRIGILGNISKTENQEGEELEIAEWGGKVDYMLHMWQDAKTRNDIHSWFYNIANIIKCAESLVGLSSELDRPTFDVNRNIIMKLFAKDCCNSEGIILDECKIYNTVGYKCKFVDEEGNECGMEFDYIDDVINHLNDHEIPKEEKENYYEEKTEYIGVGLKAESLATVSDKVSYTNWQNAFNALIKSQDFFIGLGENPNDGETWWLIHPSVADAMEKALIKTKELVKEKRKEKTKGSS